MKADVVVAICTWNNADSLDATLRSIAAQSAAAVDVLIVDNGSSDHTQSVIAQHGGGAINLASVVEPVQGLTSARQRAVSELVDAEWIAFVDDDCRLAADWIENARDVCGDVAPAVTAVGGLVELVFDREPPVWIHAIRGAYAEQRPRTDEGPVATLVGAGMIVRRGALIETGWLRTPLLRDRTGGSLQSGGDVEIALRLAQIGPLWFSPRLLLEHHIPSWRTDVGYAVKLQRALGAGATIVSQVSSRRRLATWAAVSVGIGCRHLIQTARWLISARLRGGASIPPRLQWAFWAGWTSTVVQQVRTAQKRSMIGSCVIPASNSGGL